jgi:hypothetical protein
MKIELANPATSVMPKSAVVRRCGAVVATMTAKAGG